MDHFEHLRLLIGHRITFMEPAQGGPPLVPTLPPGAFLESVVRLGSGPLMLTVVFQDGDGSTDLAGRIHLTIIEEEVTAPKTQSLDHSCFEIRGVGTVSIALAEEMPLVHTDDMTCTFPINNVGAPMLCAEPAVKAVRDPDSGVRHPRCTEHKGLLDEFQRGVTTNITPAPVLA